MAFDLRTRALHCRRHIFKQRARRPVRLGLALDHRRVGENRQHATIRPGLVLCTGEGEGWSGIIKRKSAKKTKLLFSQNIQENQTTENAHNIFFTTWQSPKSMGSKLEGVPLKPMRRPNKMLEPSSWPHALILVAWKFIRAGKMCCRK